MMSRTLKLIALLLVAVIGCTGSPKGTKIGQSCSAPADSVPALNDSPAAPGKQLPDVALTDLDGKSIHLKQLLAALPQNRPTLLMFATTECSYCAEEYGEVRNVKGKFGESMGALTVLVYETPDSAREYLKTNQIAGIVLVDPEAEAARAYNIGLVPTLFLTNSSGDINYIGNFTPEEDIVELVTKIQEGERVLEVRPGKG